MLGLQSFRAGDQLWIAFFLAIAVKESLQVEVLELLGVIHRISGHNFAVKANGMQRFSIDRFSNIREPKSRYNLRRDLQVRQVDRGICFLCIVVSQEACVGECPAKDIVHDHDGHVFVGTSDIGIVVRQLSLFARRFAIPSEAGEAALRHVGEGKDLICFLLLGLERDVRIDDSVQASRAEETGILCLKIDE